MSNLLDFMCRAFKIILCDNQKKTQIKQIKHFLYKLMVLRDLVTRLDKQHTVVPFYVEKEVWLGHCQAFSSACLK